MENVNAMREVKQSSCVTHTHVSLQIQTLYSPFTVLMCRITLI